MKKKKVVMATKKKKKAKKVVKKVVKKSKPVKKASKKVAKKKPALKKKVASKPKPQVKKPAPSIDYSKAITPLADRLVVRIVNTERMTAGGIIIPDTALVATGYLKAVVLAVGHGSKSKKGHLRPLDVKIGDTVLFAEHAGTRVEFNSEELQIIHETDVMGIVKN